MSDRPSLLPDVDWTSIGGRTNSSPLFNELADEIALLLRSSAHDLIGGRTDDVGRLILAQLAHKHSLAPGVRKRLRSEVERGEATVYGVPASTVLDLIYEARREGRLT